MDSVLKELYRSGFLLHIDSLSEQEKIQMLNEYIGYQEKNLNALLDEKGKEAFQKLSRFQSETTNRKQS